MAIEDIAALFRRVELPKALLRHTQPPPDNRFRALDCLEALRGAGT
jgi:hypothetical protein